MYRLACSEAGNDMDLNLYPPLRMPTKKTKLWKWWKSAVSSILTPSKPQAENLSQFTSHAQQVLALSRKEASRFNHNFVGTEHLLLGLMALDQCTAAKVMHNLGLEVQAVRWEVEYMIGTVADQKMIDNIPYTPCVKKVLARAVREAKELNHPNVGTEHILLGLLREDDGIAARILKRLDITAEETRSEVLRACAADKAPTDESGACQPETVPASSAVPRPMREAHMSNLTPRAQQVLLLARKEADRFHHSFVGTEHLLLGLIALGRGVAVNVLHKLGLNFENVRKEIEKLAATRPSQERVVNTPYTLDVRKVLALAARQAKALNHTYIGTEHIFLGLLEEGDGVAARALQNLGVKLEETRKEILKELDPNFGQ